MDGLDGFFFASYTSNEFIYYHANSFPAHLSCFLYDVSTSVKRSYILVANNIANNFKNSIEPHSCVIQNFNTIENWFFAIREYKFGESSCCKISFIHAWRRLLTTSTICQQLCEGINYLSAGKQIYYSSETLAAGPSEDPVKKKILYYRKLTINKINANFKNSR